MTVQYRVFRSFQYDDRYGATHLFQGTREEAEEVIRVLSLRYPGNRYTIKETKEEEAK